MNERKVESGFGCQWSADIAEISTPDRFFAESSPVTSTMRFSSLLSLARSAAGEELQGIRRGRVLCLCRCRLEYAYTYLKAHAYIRYSSPTVTPCDHKVRKP